MHGVPVIQQVGSLPRRELRLLRVESACCIAWSALLVVGCVVIGAWSATQNAHHHHRPSSHACPRSRQLNCTDGAGWSDHFCRLTAEVVSARGMVRVPRDALLAACDALDANATSAANRTRWLVENGCDGTVYATFDTFGAITCVADSTDATSAAIVRVCAVYNSTCRNVDLDGVLALSPSGSPRR